MPFDSLKSGGSEQHPLQGLPREDLDLIVELVLQSGSLKDLAAAYGVSYPTIRGRLDKVIERVRGVVEGRKRDPFSELLAGLVERGEMSVAVARVVRDAARKQMGSREGLTQSGLKQGGSASGVDPEA